MKDEQLYGHDRIQQECWMHLWNMYPQTRRLMWHTPNELRKHKGESEREFIIRLGQSKASGVMKGIWDLVFYWKGVLYIFDIKIGKDRLSDEQKDFRDKVEAQGGKSFVIDTVQQFKDICLTLPL